MKPFCLLLAFVMIHHLAAQAQLITCRISGTITNSQNMLLPGATVTLLQPRNTAFNKNIVVGEDGRFSFKKLPVGQFVLVITSVGYKKYSSEPFTIDTNQCNLLLPVVVLQQTTQKTLQEVVVTTSRPLTEQLVDRTIVNVDAMITAAGGSALDVLARSPGVRVQPDGDISLYQKGECWY